MQLEYDDAGMAEGMTHLGRLEADQMIADALDAISALRSRTSKISGRLHCYFGGKDLLIPTDQVDAIRSALEGSGVVHEVHVYEEADHGFHCDQRATYHEASAKDAWRRTFEFFRETLRA